MPLPRQNGLALRLEPHSAPTDRQALEGSTHQGGHPLAIVGQHEAMWAAGRRRLLLEGLAEVDKIEDVLWHDPDLHRVAVAAVALAELKVQGSRRLGAVAKALPEGNVGLQH
ncbi:MAG: hypothetical protein EBX65_10190, partial [Betaproteobacteria bacterium]|nr:hypothetical protein [Betaproteobacteria bacterium]